MKAEIIRLEAIRHRYAHRILPDVEREYSDLMAPSPLPEALDRQVLWPAPPRPSVLEIIRPLAATLLLGLALGLLLWRTW